MIVKMHKTYVGARSSDADRLLDALRQLGVIHLTPVDRAAAVAHARTLSEIDHLNRAVQLLLPLEPVGEAPTMSPLAAAEETLAIQRESAERRVRLSTLHRTLKKQAVWGDVRLDDLEELTRAGLAVNFFSVPAGDADHIQAELVCPLDSPDPKRQLVVVINRNGEMKLPESAEQVERPDQDNPSIRAEAAEIDAKLRQGAERLVQLAGLVEQMRAAGVELSSQAEYTVAQRGAMTDENIFAVQGWVPAERAAALAADLAAAGIEAAVETAEPSDEETPPTLIKYPRWVKPIEPLSRMLGTVPGYHEIDLSAFIMLALPLFAAMLLGDAGYGLLFTLIGVLGYRRITASSGRATAQLVLVFAVTTLAWGLLTGNCFGITPTVLLGSGGMWVQLGEFQRSIALFWDADADVARNIIIKLSFIFGSIHLISAHLLQVLRLAPDSRAVGELGWASFLAGMLGVVWMLFFPNEMFMSPTVIAAFLIGGAVGFLLFSCPSRNPIKRVGMGLANSILPMIATFSDTMSYIRLMAVGMASFYIAKAFNDLAYSIGSSSSWLIPASVLIVLFAHALNIGLGLIAIFAHGVRLNLLEFSSNAGVQWTGHSYRPFAAPANEGVA